ncbi:hypothetical protein [Antrihabitans cavernicola]|uniref:Uncharacterized protein n=1 Tax=Antrihabitans cavernicola TaxID=2495913 RepID=A0A5A7S508_9NOCA|nr:hypothetical protein [Spelaeibacter cavernicola]KAA0017980.1 hypothetical protein FOY51_24660 [Spelaeibacter cavernicola]
MGATIHYLVPRDARRPPIDGFTIRLAGGVRWEMRNRDAYGGSYVVHSWCKCDWDDAIEHCYRLNGYPPETALVEVAGSWR